MAGDISATWDVNYAYEKYSVVDPTSSGSVSIKIRQIKRTICKSPSGLETLLKQGYLDGDENEPTEFVFEIQSMLFAGEETCTRFVASVLSQTKIESRVQHCITHNISKDLINIGRRLRQEEGNFSVRADVEVVKETSLNGYISFYDYEFEGSPRAIKRDCIICLEEMSNGPKKIMKLVCSHSFHRDCILSWLRGGNHSCPTCRDDIHNPRLRKELKPGERKSFTMQGVTFNFIGR